LACAPLRQGTCDLAHRDLEGTLVPDAVSAHTAADQGQNAELLCDAVAYAAAGVLDYHRGRHALDPIQQGRKPWPSLDGAAPDPADGNVSRVAGSVASIVPA
jgi:hypothetical protein